MTIRVERTTDGGRGYRWAVRCEAHGRRLLTETRAAAEAEAAHPENFCDGCRDAHGGRRTLPASLRAYLLATRGEAAVAAIEGR